MNRYVNNKFSNQYKATIGADFLTKEVSGAGLSFTDHCRAPSLFESQSHNRTGTSVASLSEYNQT